MMTLLSQPVRTSVPHINRIPLEEAKQQGKDEAFASIDFDFNIIKERENLFPAENHRTHAAL